MVSSPDRSLRSLLKPWQRWLLRVGLAVAALVLANTLYLVAVRLLEAVDAAGGSGGVRSASRLLQVMVLGHTGFGLLLAVVLLPFVVAHLPTVWVRRHRGSVISGIAALLAGGTLLVTGLFILTAAASEANRWAWWLHVGAALALPAGYLVHRFVGYTRPPRSRVARYAGATALLAIILVAGHGVEAGLDFERTTQVVASPPNATGSEEADGSPGFRPAAWVPLSSPFFPSAATTASGGALPASVLIPEIDDAMAEEVAREVAEDGFAAGVGVGAETCRRCHADIVEQWRSSAHRFASFNNPFYEATISDLRAGGTPGGVETEEGMEKSRWCAGCHDPALLLTGAMTRPVERASAQAQAGLTCTACHAIDRIHGLTGNGNYGIADLGGDPYIFGDAAPGTPGAFLHDAALKARPAAHKELFLKPVFRTSEFCATCHKVSIPPEVNDYRWLRGQDEYDAWHDSGVARNASRTFYLPDRARVCQDCHMPPEAAPLGDLAAKGGTVRSHRFLAANTALPFVRGDTTTVRRTEEFLRDGRLRVDIFALRLSGEVSGGTGEPGVVTALGDVAPPLPAESGAMLEVVVRNLGVGHTFPGGTNDSNEGWLELTVLDDEGRVWARSGHLREDGALDPLAHAYGAVLLDARGEAIDRRNGQDIRVAAATNVIGPGTADAAHYELRLPPEAAGRTLTVRARLLWRKFTRPYTEFAHGANPEGFKRFPDVPDLPVTEIARDEVRIPVAASTPVPALPEPVEGSGDDDRGFPEWMRYNDYGIALLLEGNTRLATRAFLQVEALEPERLDGPLNLARTALAAGNLEEAYGHLEDVERVRSGDPRAAWVWGRVLSEDGRYEPAAQAYRAVLEAFPDDRAAWRNLGRTLYLDQRPEEAIEALDRVLRIDPEDRIAHYYRMLALRVVGRTEEAAVAEAAFTHYGIDETAQALSRTFREANPGVNLMAQPIHTHGLEWSGLPGPAEGR